MLSTGLIPTSIENIRHIVCHYFGKLTYIARSLSVHPSLLFSWRTAQFSLAMNLLPANSYPEREAHV